MLLKLCSTKFSFILGIHFSLFVERVGEYM